MSQHHALYGRRWRKARLEQLQEHPLCADHQARGVVVAATVVDHRIPHKGDETLFWDRSNWQSLCKVCHDSAKQREERGVMSAGCSLAGLPIDASHPWNRPAG